MGSERIVFKVTLGELAEVPGSPFSYWAPKSLRELFKKFPPLDRDVARRPDQPKIADVKQGLATADDLRFTRYWWEVATEKIAISREETIQGNKKWVPFAKGGKPFYHDIQLVVNWGRDGEEIKNWINPRTGRPFSNVWMLRQTEQRFFFRAGLAWVKSDYTEAQGIQPIDARLMPAGTIFTAKQMGIFPNASSFQKLAALCGFLNSKLAVRFASLVNSAGRSYEAGHIALLPIKQTIFESALLTQSVNHAHDLLREWATGDETSTVFVAPWILQLYWRWQGKGDVHLMPQTGHPLARDFEWHYGVPQEVMDWLSTEMEDGFSLRALAEACVQWETWLRQRIDEIQREIDDEVYRLYGISDEDRKLIEAELTRTREEEPEAEGSGEQIDKLEETTRDDVLTPEEHIRRLIHFLAHEVIKEDLDGIVPLEDCFPAGRAEMEPGLARRVRAKLRAIFGEEVMPTVEWEVREALGKPLDEWLADDFFGYHLGLYRLRPLIWQVVASRTRRTRRSVRMSPAPKDFSVFLYWHKLNADTLRKVRSVYLEPYLRASLRELREAERHFRELQAGEAPLRTLREAERMLEVARSKHEALERLAEPIDTLLRPHSIEVQSRSAWVKERVNEIISQGYRPNRDYGVRVNIEPLKQAGILHPESNRVKG